eukprot:CAMPEP_0206258038 /NCGR_PEP_ID=MMETSP0047_2-20121206/25691_1 /ASSEMBLY_ACC=CAM_ASM_000192 /TAXON_ID=195065 /ORGANISM="Chroomonas mesostigmatica_cf, Strain CCMP1168" /LENGTH=390 /DNA_ID=CAMNT_0053684725 /DNA_START=73 /DNA_END=1243 /DNA_ORIENTATION=-
MQRSSLRPRLLIVAALHVCAALALPLHKPEPETLSNTPATEHAHTTTQARGWAAVSPSQWSTAATAAPELPPHNNFTGSAGSPAASRSLLQATGTPLSWYLNVRLPSPPTRVQFPALAGAGHFAYVYGGMDDQQRATASFHTLNTASGNPFEWVWKNFSGLPSAPAARVYAATCAVGLRFYLHGGLEPTSNVVFGDLHVFDASLDPPAWADLSFVPGRPFGRYGHAMVAVGSRLVLMGDRMDTVHVLDTAARAPQLAWRELRSRFQFALANARGLVFLVGGISGGNFTPVPGQHVLDMSKDPPEWSDLSSLPNSPGPAASVPGWAILGDLLLLVNGTRPSIDTIQRGDVQQIRTMNLSALAPGSTPSSWPLGLNAPVQWLTSNPTAGPGP